MSEPHSGGSPLRRLLGDLARRIGIDRRTTFRSLDRLPADGRRARTPGVQFYSGHPNIGNYLPVLGIQRMMGRGLDTWNIHDRSIDFDFVNRHYHYAIIGGAGLLYAPFEPFWRRFADECALPYVVWGVGGCFPDSEADPGVDPSVVKPVLERALLVNLRDQGTADFYGLPSAHISACPTIVYLKEFRARRRPQPGAALFASHEPLVGREETGAIERLLRGALPRLAVTDNVQTRRLGLRDIIVRYYLPSEIVVTSRLHGAIIAYGLGIPYVAIARDRKLREFHRTYGNGILAESLSELPPALVSVREIPLSPVAYEPVERFGEQARARLAEIGR